MKWAAGVRTQDTDTEQQLAREGGGRKAGNLDDRVPRDLPGRGHLLARAPAAAGPSGLLGGGGGGGGGGLFLRRQLEGRHLPVNAQKLAD